MEKSTFLQRVKNWFYLRRFRQIQQRRRERFRDSFERWEREARDRTTGQQPQPSWISRRERRFGK